MRNFLEYLIPRVVFTCGALAVIEAWKEKHQPDRISHESL